MKAFYKYLMFKDCLIYILFQSSAAYHASLAHKTNHSFLPNGLFKYFDRYALSTQRLFYFLKVYFAHSTFRPICCVRPPQIWSHTLYINNCRHRRRGRGKKQTLWQINLTRASQIIRAWRKVGLWCQTCCSSDSCWIWVRPGRVPWVVQSGLEEQHLWTGEEF